MRSATVIDVVIASPSDLVEDRKTVVAVIAQWNADHGGREGAVLIPVMWERNATPLVGIPPQDVINSQLIDDSDLLIGAFWTRVGTATAGAVSGTIEEITRFAEAGKPAGVWFCRRPAVPPRTADQIEQQRKLLELEEAMRSQSLNAEYTSEVELRTQVTSFLTREVRRLLQHASPGATALATGPSTPRGEVVASLQREPLGTNSSSDYIVLLNRGGGAATNVVLAVESGEFPMAAWRVFDDTPVEALTPGGSYRYLLYITSEMARRCQAHVAWTNEDDSAGTSQSTLGL